MTCDPNTLSALSSKLRALTEQQLFIARTYLICQWSKNAGNMANNQNYLTFLTIPSSSPASSTTYFIGGDTILPNNVTYVNAALTVLKAGTIMAAYLKARITNPGSAELVTHSVTLNNAADILIATGSYNANVMDISNLAMNQPVNAGDTLAIKIETPAWVTPPTVVRWFGYLLIV